MAGTFFCLFCTKRCQSVCRKRRCLLELTIDKKREVCYNIQAVNETATQQRRRVDHEKVFEKTLKKGLTKRRRCDIIIRLSRRADGNDLKGSFGHWKLNNNERSTKHKKYVQEQISQFLENTTQTKSKRAIKLERNDIWCLVALYIPFFESLILAQDERWRRA